jgi:transcriptional regulator with XRE-family HTH domain
MLVYGNIFLMSTGRSGKFMDNLLKERIDELCAKKGITINRMEKEAGLTVGSVKNWNDHMPSVDKVEKVAKYFGVTVDSLLGYTGNYDDDLLKLMDMASWLSKEDIVALLVVAEQLKKGK